MHVADITSDQIANFLVRTKSEVEAKDNLGVEIYDSNCAMCHLLFGAWLKPEIMLMMQQITLSGGDVPSVLFGFHLALEFMQAMQEAEELRQMTKL
jgi:hypothetical protein